MHASALILTAFLAIVQLALATPPACLLAALEVQPNPADISGLCGTLQPAMEGNLTHVCSGPTLSAAYSVYSANCLAKGVTVAALPTQSASGSGSGSATPTGTASGSSSSSSSSSKPNSAPGTNPKPLLFALSGLLATTLTGVLFL